MRPVISSTDDNTLFADYEPQDQERCDRTIDEREGERQTQKKRMGETFIACERSLT
jgi:hypothetical protein